MVVGRGVCTIYHYHEVLNAKDGSAAGTKSDAGSNCIPRIIVWSLSVLRSKPRSYSVAAIFGGHDGLQAGNIVRKSFTDKPSSMSTFTSNLFKCT